MSLIGAKMMAKPLGQMPYQPVGDLLLKFPEVKAAENYRRDLDLDTAIARVGYTVSGVQLHARGVLQRSGSGDRRAHRGRQTRPDLLHRRHADAAEGDGRDGGQADTLVMRGVNGASQGIPARLKFQARVRVLATGGKTTAAEDTISVSGADSAVAADRRCNELQEVQRHQRRPRIANPDIPGHHRQEVVRGAPASPSGRLPAAVPTSFARPGRCRRGSDADRRADQGVRRRATTRSSLRSTSSSAVTCSCPALGRAGSRRTSRGCGTRA